MPHKQIIAIIITLAIILVFGIILSTNYFKLSLFKPSLASGGVGVGPYFEPRQAPNNVVGFRYKFRVNENQSPGTKIIFGWKRLYNSMTGNNFFSLETNIGANRVQYSDNQYNCIWSLQGQRLNQASIGLSIADYYKNGMIGARQLDDRTILMFPRQNSGIDVTWNSDKQKVVGLTKIELIAQTEIVGKNIFVEYIRGEKFTSDGSLTDWGYRFKFDSHGDLEWIDKNSNGRYDGGEALCDPNLPTGLYRKWIAKIIINGVQYNLEYALPEDRAQYFAPWEINTFGTEFFDKSGFFQTYFWDLEILKEGESVWQPLKKWKVGYQSDHVENIGYGDKLATYEGKSVIEISNDGTDTYYKVGDIFEVPIPVTPSTTLSASPNPCTIPQNQTTCSSTITWQTTNAPDACVFAKETKQLLACAASGNQTATGITEQGTTFEVHLNNDINSQLLASVLVKGQKQTIVQYSLNVSKSGTGQGAITSTGINCGSDCNETYNQGALVTLTATPDINSTFSNWSVDCSGTSSTCSLTMNSNKSATAVFEKKIIITTVCSTGPLRACIDSISPNPAKIGETIMLKGHYESDDSNKVINKFRWRIDSTSDKGSFLGDGQSLLLNRSLPTGVHTIYFRVGTPRWGKILTEWSNWIAKDFTVETVTSVCGNNICEQGETYLNCPKDCPAPPKPQCSDGIDNDNDSKIDYPSDPGCTLATDNDEKDAPQTKPQCSDGLDNDNDNKRSKGSF